MVHIPYTGVRIGDIKTWEALGDVELFCCGLSSAGTIYDRHSKRRINLVIVERVSGSKISNAHAAPLDQDRFASIMPSQFFFN